MLKRHRASGTRSSTATVLVLALTLCALGPVAQGQEKDEQLLSKEELEQIVSPIALHPDALLSQILMASTYPLEVVEAARWQKENEKLEGEALAKALEKQTWDASVKSLINFPDVLIMMNERLSWSQKLGNAVLSQQKDVMEAIQRLRARAKEAGNLETTEQQTVVVEKEIIVIESTKTEVIYVPTYNPVVVYGTWPYPTYAPPPPYYPPGYVAGAAVIGFAAGVACSYAWGYAWGGCNWRGGDIDIDVDKNVKFNNKNKNERNKARQNIDKRGGKGGRGSWKHDPSHRKGVGYADRKTAQRFNRGGDAQRRQAREQFRGRTGSGRSGFDRAGRGSTGRSSAGRTGSGRSGSRRSASTAGRSGSSRTGGAFGGSRSGRSSRSHASRGHSSRSSSGRRGSFGGRSGGGRRGGGGRR
jgi:hypothetical protein